MNLEDCDVIFDDNQSICQECHIGQKRVYCITTKWEKHEWAKDYRQSGCPPLVLRAFAGSQAFSVPARGRKAAVPARGRGGVSAVPLGPGWDMLCKKQRC